MSLAEQLIQLAQPRTTLSPAQRLQAIVLSSRQAQAIHAAAKLELADHLAAGPLAVADLAAATGARPDRLERFLRALIGYGLLERLDDGRFALTPLGVGLRRDQSESAWDFVMAEGQSWHWETWGDLSDALSGDHAPFERRRGQPFYAWSEVHPEETAAYYRSLAWPTVALDAIASLPVFGDLHHVVDIGGGLGHLLRRLLASHEHLAGTCYDLPKVVAAGRALPPVDRLDFEAGDAFTAVPAEADAYLYSRVLHCWSDADCVRLLRTCRNAMKPGAKVLILENAPEAGYESVIGLLDLELLLFTDGGKVRSVSEFARLLTQAGLHLEASHVVLGPLVLHVAVGSGG